MAIVSELALSFYGLSLYVVQSLAKYGPFSNMVRNGPNWTSTALKSVVAHQS